MLVCITVPLRAMLEDVRTKLLELRTKKREESAKYKELVEKRYGCILITALYAVGDGRISRTVHMCKTYGPLLLH